MLDTSLSIRGLVSDREHRRSGSTTSLLLHLLLIFNNVEKSVSYKYVDGKGMR